MKFLFKHEVLKLFVYTPIYSSYTYIIQQGANHVTDAQKIDTAINK